MGSAAVLRELVESGSSVLAPDVHDLMAAQLAEELGFEAVYVGSFGSAASRWGLPDQSLLTMSQLLDHFQIVTEAIDIPVITSAGSKRSMSIAGVVIAES
jgi:2-methylisocitrate lyase-like PEP mutase family enzyme